MHAVFDLDELERFISLPEQVTRVLVTIEFALQAVTVVVSVAALAISWRRGNLPTATAMKRHSIALVSTLGIAVLAAVAGLAFGVPQPFSWLTCILLALLVGSRATDQEFWRALAVSAGTFTVFGIATLLSFSVNAIRSNGDTFLGVQRLTELGGPNLNPAYPLWWAPLLSVAVLRYGLPIALTVTLSWLVATRVGLSVIERLALLLTATVFASAVFQGPVLTLIHLSFGIYAGAPWYLLVLGTVPSLVLVLLFGLGSLDGLVTGFRALNGLVPVAEATAEGVRTIFEGLGDRSVDRTRRLSDASLTRFLADTAVRNYPKSRWVAIFTVSPLLFLASTAAFDDLGRVTHPRPVHITKERTLGVVVEAAFPVAGNEVWLVEPSGRLSQTNLDTGQTARTELVASSVTLSQGRAIALLPGPPSRVVTLEDGQARDILQLPARLSGALAVSPEAVYVGTKDGTLYGFSRKNGRQFARVSLTKSIARLMVRGADVWVLTDLPDSVVGRFLAERRDARTLAKARRQPLDGTGALDDLAIPETGTMWLQTIGVLTKFEPDKKLTEMGQGRGERALVPLEGERLFPDRDGQSVWGTYQAGQLRHLTRQGGQFADLPYQEVSGVVELADGTVWALVSRRTLEFFPGGDVRTESLLVQFEL